MNIESMAYGFVFALLGGLVGYAISESIKQKYQDVWKAKYELLKEFNNQQYADFQRERNNTLEVIKRIQFPGYLHMTITHEKEDTTLP